ncbi:MAG: methylated-DNA--[protein]-cysteine S-methyltransferase [Gammaproteobacteria bacterium]
MEQAGEYERFYRSPLGVLGIRLCSRGLAAIRFLSDDDDGAGRDPAPDPIGKEFDRYFYDPGHRFSLRLCARGTPFQTRVWRLLQTIPSGSVITYGELARLSDSGPRAVAGACGANPLPIVVPCHRVVAAESLGGYMGGSERGLCIKRWLLRHERAIS